MTSQLNRDLETTGAPQTTFDRIFRDQQGNLVIIQVPNLPVLVGITATILHLVLPGSTFQATSGLVGFGALFTWAWLELFEGVNYFRRSLGLVSLVGLIVLGASLFNMG